MQRLSPCFRYIFLLSIFINYSGQISNAEEDLSIKERTQKAIERADRVFDEKIGESKNIDEDSKKVVNISKLYFRELGAHLAAVQKEFEGFQDSDVFEYSKISSSADVKGWEAIVAKYQTSSNKCQNFLQGVDNWFEGKFREQNIKGFETFIKQYHSREEELRNEKKSLPTELCQAHLDYATRVINVTNLLLAKQNFWRLEDGDLESDNDEFLDSYNDSIEKAKVYEKKLNKHLVNMSH